VRVTWGGIHNTRDLGGMHGSRGTIAPQRLFRMPRPDELNEQGWIELQSAGVRTLVDLRNSDEIRSLPLQPERVRSVVRSIENQSDEHFMSRHGHELGSPAYYRDSLRRWPEKIAAAITAIAHADDGGVVVHCSAGRDRTGLIVAMVLDLCGVELQSILDDYESVFRETNEFMGSQLVPRERVRDEPELIDAIRSARSQLASLFADLDTEAYLSEAGVSPSEIELLRARLLVPTIS
jgi:protein-tyrosine phosphatase